MLIEFLCTPGFNVGGVTGSEKCVVAEVIPVNSGKQYTIVERTGKHHTLPAKAFQRLYKILIVGNKAKYYRFVDAPAEEAELSGVDRKEFDEKAVMTLEDLRSLCEESESDDNSDEMSGYDLIENDEEGLDGTENIN